MRSTHGLLLTLKHVSSGVALMLIALLGTPASSALAGNVGYIECPGSTSLLRFYASAGWLQRVEISGWSGPSKIFESYEGRTGNGEGIVIVNGGSYKIKFLHQRNDGNWYQTSMRKMSSYKFVGDDGGGGNDKDYNDIGVTCEVHER